MAADLAPRPPAWAKKKKQHGPIFGHDVRKKRTRRRRDHDGRGPRLHCPLPPPPHLASLSLATNAFVRLVVFLCVAAKLPTSASREQARATREGGADDGGEEEEEEPR